MQPTEILASAFVSLRRNRLRSALTLVGVVAGVASIIGVMTAIQVAQSTMEKELSVLGATTFQVQKWPPGNFHGNNGRDWREIEKRAPITIAQADAIRKRAKSVDLVGSELWNFGVAAASRSAKTEPNLVVCGGTPEYAPNNTHYIADGRNLLPEDIATARSVAVIGPAIADELYPFVDPVGQKLRVNGHDLEVVGVFEKKTSAMGGGYDSYILMPYPIYERIFGARDGDGRLRSNNVTVRAKSPELLGDAIEETRAILRQERRVRAGADDDFEFFTNDSQIRMFNQATLGVKAAAIAIGGIALLVAGVGIMNIMLVSVTERTREIGLRKALGAPARAIRFQFLSEAVVLTNLGGLVGVLIGLALGNIVTLFTDFEVDVPLGWAALGLLFCTAVGVGFGYWPAAKAAGLEPVDALRFE